MTSKWGTLALQSHHSRLLTSRMPFVRTLIAALLFLAWMPATNSCLLASLFPEKVADCCANEGGDESATCDQCVTLENGFQRSLLQPLTLDTPTVVEDAWLSEIMRAMQREVSDEPLRAVREAPPPSLRLWTFVVRTALPVRGPSLAA